ncbi:MAG: hypothetical protein ACRDRR_20010 [Pseudonocardiaceae bacterium]
MPRPTTPQPSVAPPPSNRAPNSPRSDGRPRKRAALRQEARQQLDAVLARFHTTPTPDTETAATSAPPARRGKPGE